MVLVIPLFPLEVCVPCKAIGRDRGILFGSGLYKPCI